LLRYAKAMDSGVLLIGKEFAGILWIGKRA
jgi:hypothetical protein